jgi:glycine/D-amino acid oxidase-like deaminating enzyme
LTAEITMPDRKPDVLVIGGGIVGLASAYHIKRGDPSASVLLIDKASAAGQGDTAKSAAAVRDMFSSEIARTLASTTIDFYADLQNRGVDLGLRFIGYLWLMSRRQFQKFEMLQETLRQDNLQFRVWSADELKQMIPDFKPFLAHTDSEVEVMNLEDVTAAVQGIKCGIIAAEKLVRFYEGEFCRLGGEVMYRLPVEKLLVEASSKLGIEGEPFEWQEKVIAGAKTLNGEIRARKVVLALGAWGRELLDPIGLDCHMNPIRKTIFVLKGSKVQHLLTTAGFNADGILPMTVLPRGGVYLRPVPGEMSLYTAMTEGWGRSFALTENQPAEESFFLYNLSPLLSKYFPILEGVRPANMWAGRQDWSCTDKNPYIFQKGNAVIALGTSGNGIMKADAIGRIVAALTRNEETAELWGKKFEVSKVGLTDRIIEHESFALE